MIVEQLSQIMLIDAKPKYVVDKIIPFSDHVKEELLPNVSSIAVYKTKIDKQLKPKVTSQSQGECTQLTKLSRRARLVADGTGLENRKGFTLLVGSNPTPSALALNEF